MVIVDRANRSVTMLGYDNQATRTNIGKQLGNGTHLSARPACTSLLKRLTRVECSNLMHSCYSLLLLIETPMLESHEL